MEEFYSQWLLEEQILLTDLVSVPRDRPDLHIPLISRALSHHTVYESRKSEIADRDVFQAFSAYWLTPLERSFTWLGGMMPTTIFHFVPSDLDENRRIEIERLRLQTAERASELEEGMRQVQETITVLMALAAMYGHVRNGEARGYAAERSADTMRALYTEAGNLRKQVVTKLIDILPSAHAVRFLASVANHHLWIRCYGLRSTANHLAQTDLMSVAI